MHPAGEKVVHAVHGADVTEAIIVFRMPAGGLVLKASAERM